MSVLSKLKIVALCPVPCEEKLNPPAPGMRAEFR